MMTDSERHTYSEADVENHRGQKQPSGRCRARGEPGSALPESGRLRHREHLRSEETGPESRRGELSTGQEP